MSEETKLAAVEKSVENVEVEPAFASPAGDKATEVLDKLFSQLSVYLQEKLPDGWSKSFLMAQLTGLYGIARAFITKQLT